ncbi:cytochrome c oxidase subunit 3 [Parvularcula flava]|uniref:Probable cytochrome c oxidase subunit 3 n=1 Tax=Aquisalinus luteolus TaxID=1566827 RepID=A0A8J3A0D4_9PROT|nr:cytochrome c oxidase subunit 3 [Aquisalinus luteolus]NHK26563.1 cytochrome c oxidase subunit 3 [Aquisalinus luteolus]GGH92716.1 cytochrome B562 [Aquisalinus luteolus]
MAGAVKHDYHLVNPSPWPLLGSVSAMIMMLGAVTWAHSGANENGVEVAGLFALKGNWIFFFGLAGVLFTMFGWWRDIIKESLKGENTAPVIRIGLRYGMVLFIASEVMFFAAWFWAFFGAALFPGAGDPVLLADGTQMLNANGDPAYMMNEGRFYATGAQWPPVGVEPLSAWQLPLINTLILLLSGTTVTWAHHAITIGDQKGFVQGLAITIALGVFFSFLQAVEYYEAIAYGLFSFSGGIYGGSFFMATGFHGLHVIIGTLFLAVCLGRALAGHFTKDRHFGFEAAAWYWHFVDVVWLFLFAAIYVLGNQGLLS